MKQTDAKVSIIMGIYNCEDTLSRCIDSLLQQTFQDWQLIMCDDGSKDATYEQALLFQARYPEKIMVLKNPENKGLNYTLNRCLKAAKGVYVARQDADDYSTPERLQLEVDFLDQHPEYALVSGFKDHFDEAGIWGTCTEIKEPVMLDIFFGPPFCHAACMIRREALEQVGGYSVAERLLRVEDYHLWYKLYREGYRGYNLQQTIYLCEDDRKAYARRNLKNRFNEMYVKRLIIRSEGLSFWYHLHALKPLIVGLLPQNLYNYLHKQRLKN